MEGKRRENIGWPSELRVVTSDEQHLLIDVFLFCLMYNVSDKISTVIFSEHGDINEEEWHVVASRSNGSTDELKLKITPNFNFRKTVKKGYHR